MGSWRGWLRILALAILVVAVGRYLDSELTWVYEAPPIPLQSLRVSPDLEPADRLPAQPGDLAGANLLLVTLDTTRPDRIGLYGNDAIQTPVLDGLARDGAVFSAARAVSPTTLPAHASILTGLQPRNHGARTNGVYLLADSHLTLAEVLATRGYATAAFVSSFVLDARYGLAQGFDLYDAETSEAATAYGDPERKGDETTRSALRWLRRAGEDPFFLWVHYYDPHVNFDPPHPYSEQYASQPYDGEIAFVDTLVGRLLAGLPPRAAAETLVVVVGDHGESHGHHGEANHGFLLSEAVLQIPLILRAEGRLDGGVHLTRPVSQVDLMPTLLSLLGIDPTGIEGAREFDGIDLTQPAPADRLIIAETIHGLVNYGWAPLAAIYRGAFKYVHGPAPELYDLVSDPLEASDLYDRTPARAAPLLAALQQELGSDIDAALAPPIMRSPEPEEVEKLRALGYVIDATPSDARDSVRADPKQMLKALNELNSVLSAKDVSEGPGVRFLRWLSGNSLPRTAEERIARLEEIRREHPDFVPTFQYLAALYQGNGQLKEAELAIGQLLELVPDAVLAANQRAEILLAMGRTSEARELFVELIARESSFARARFNLGRLLLQEGRPSEAADELLRALEIEPDNREVREALIEALRSSGRKAEIRAEWRKQRR